MPKSNDTVKNFVNIVKKKYVSKTNFKARNNPQPVAKLRIVVNLFLYLSD